MSDDNSLNSTFKAYRIHYRLTQDAVERLAQLKKNQYSRIESGRQEPKAAESDAICGIYGLKTYQVSNPKHRKPSFKNLPADTQEEILKIKQSGSQPRINQQKHDLGKEIDKLIAQGKFDNPITAKKLLAFLPDEVKKSIDNDSARITDLLKRAPRNMVIAIVPKPKDATGAGNWYQKIAQ